MPDQHHLNVQKATGGGERNPRVREAVHALGLDEVARVSGMRGVLKAAGAGTVRELLKTPRPQTLQFRLTDFLEHESTDALAQGGNDEVYVACLAYDSARIRVGASGEPVAQPQRSGPVGDVSADPLRSQFRRQPLVLMEFTIPQQSFWPRTFVVNLLLIEEDAGDIDKVVREVTEALGSTVEKEVGEAVTGAAAATGASIGAAVGSAIPFAGSVLGAAIGALAGYTIGEIYGAIRDGLANEVFAPLTIELTVPTIASLRDHPEIGRSHSREIREHGAHYTIAYDWRLSSPSPGTKESRLSGGNAPQSGSASLWVQQSATGAPASRQDPERS